MKHTCPKCGTNRKSFEEIFVHICSCTVSPKVIETTAPHKEQSDWRP